MSVNPNKNYVGIVISGVRKDYILDDNFIKYLGIPLGSRRLGKVKFIETKIKKIFEEIDKLEKKGNTSELYLNLVEITIPWNGAEINQEKFEKEAMKLKSKLRPFETKDVMNSTLTVARIKKEEKYKKIIKAADDWLKRNKEEIMIKHKVSDVGVKCSYVIISNLGVVPKATELDVCGIVSSSEKEKSRYGRIWLKIMVSQAIRGSFECYICGKGDHGT
jgi:hypothetical protein